MNPEQPWSANSGSAGLPHKIRIAQRSGSRAQYPRRTRPTQQPEHQKRDQHRKQWRHIQRHDRANRDQQKQPRQRKEQIRHRHCSARPPATQISRQSAYHGRHQGREQSRRWSQQERDARAIQDAGEAITSNVICAQPVLARWRSSGNLAILLSVACWSEPVRRQRNANYEQQYGACDLTPQLHDSCPRSMCPMTSALELASRVTIVTRIVMFISNGRSRAKAACHASCPTPANPQRASTGIAAPTAILTETP